ncbi:MAG: hypothetical protein HY370_01890 [Proteobacteria bacterium]|nr:hypothetical protein [Pseudomonadota bacterium]
MPHEDMQKNRNTVIYANSLFAVKPHRKVVSGNSYIVALREEDMSRAYPNFLKLIYDDGGQNLKLLFDAVAKGTQQGHSGRKIFWLINATDDQASDVNHTHSKESLPHAHVIRGPLPENYKYGYILEEKTYTPSPRRDFKAELQAFMHQCDIAQTGETKISHIAALPDGIKESPHHLVFCAPDFLGFTDFVEHAEKADYAALNGFLSGSLSTYMHQGGARVICDDFDDMGIFTLRIQAGDQKHKWFERPSIAP